MSTVNYLSVIERYREHRTGLQQLLASILSGIATPELIGNSAALRKTMRALTAYYPFADLIYTLDQNGIQTSDNISNEKSPRNTQTNLAICRCIKFFNAPTKGNNPAGSSCYSLICLGLSSISGMAQRLLKVRLRGYFPTFLRISHDK